ncbi:hypothetical protein B0H14DRAFT_3465743 [Mycena olivaceomarginata]|nr:hypothetical protein B0H14DRAFT_3465743 [Mycena olivaceomarginata]
MPATRSDPPFQRRHGPSPAPTLAFRPALSARPPPPDSRMVVLIGSWGLDAFNATPPNRHRPSVLVVVVAASFACLLVLALSRHQPHLPLDAVPRRALNAMTSVNPRWGPMGVARYTTDRPRSAQAKPHQATFVVLLVAPASSQRSLPHFPAFRSAVPAPHPSPPARRRPSVDMRPCRPQNPNPDGDAGSATHRPPIPTTPSPRCLQRSRRCTCWRKRRLRAAAAHPTTTTNFTTEEPRHEDQEPADWGRLAPSRAATPSEGRTRFRLARHYDRQLRLEFGFGVIGVLLVVVLVFFVRLPVVRFSGRHSPHAYTAPYAHRHPDTLLEPSGTSRRQGTTPTDTDADKAPRPHGTDAHHASSPPIICRPSGTSARHECRLSGTYRLVL